jgi:hypothetical protein
VSRAEGRRTRPPGRVPIAAWGKVWARDSLHD